MTRQLARNSDPPALWQSFKRQSIQQAVIQLMCRDGLESVTMERVAEEAGIAKGTVYLHFRDKQELLDEVKEASLSPLISKLDEIFRSDAAPAAKLRSYSLRYLTYFDERKDLFRILLYEREVTRVQASRYQGDRYRHLVDESARVIAAGIADGTFREVDPHSVAAMWVESNFAMLNLRLRTERPKPVEENAAMVSDLFIHGLHCETPVRKRRTR
jgi:Transcriptional regulator